MRVGSTGLVNKGGIGGIRGLCDGRNLLLPNDPVTNRLWEVSFGGSHVPSPTTTYAGTTGAMQSYTPNSCRMMVRFALED